MSIIDEFFAVGTSQTVKLSTIHTRVSQVAASQILNRLLENVVSASTLQSFRYHLKAFLYQRSVLHGHLVVVLAVKFIA